jgi:O-antigen ligase
MFADIINNPDWGFVLSLVGTILGVITLVQTRLANLLAWGVVAIGLAGVVVWWPS